MMNRIKTGVRAGVAPLVAAVALSLVIVPAALADGDSAMRWWNTLSPEQMVAALHGDKANEMQAKAAKKPYAKLDGDTKKLVDAATKTIYGEGGFDSVGQWWETLDCRLMRVAAGDGITADPSSPFCAHYPGSGKAKIMDEASTKWVDVVGQALLGRKDPGKYPK
ncbi:MAG: hypothetical protein OXE53_07360 [Deltaproteobacteria bacterium]|nr:hypothetical protein [Deltaproteobacteria bacterium]